MPSVEENQNKWNQNYDWKNRGDEWSDNWGSAAMQWQITLLPRICKYLPAESVLEIAPGFGRWTQFLKDYSTTLKIVDLSKKCISACKERFTHSENIEYFVNDGKTLDMISDNSTDFVFSFDSLVHADEDAISSYLNHLSRIMKKDAVGFIHHSNLGNCTRWLDDANFNHGWRCQSMTYQKFETYARGNDLICIGQELVSWGNRPRDCMIDCFSLITKTESKWKKDNRVTGNKDFMKEAVIAKNIYNQYFHKENASKAA